MKGNSMFRNLFLIAASIIILLPSFAQASVEYEVASTLREIMDLWKVGDYDELYDYGNQASKARISRGEFVQRMNSKTWFPACCSQTIRDIEITNISEYENKAYAKARIGYGKQQRSTADKVIEQIFLMVLESEKWRINLFGILLSPEQDSLIN